MYAGLLIVFGFFNSGSNTQVIDTHDWIKHVAKLKKREAALLAKQEAKLAQEIELREQIRRPEQLEVETPLEVKQIKVVEHKLQETHYQKLDIENELIEVENLLLQYNNKLLILKREQEIEALLLLI